MEKKITKKKNEEESKDERDNDQEQKTGEISEEEGDEKIIASTNFEELKKEVEKEIREFKQKEEKWKAHSASLINQLERERKKTVEEIVSANKKLIEQLLFFLDNFEQAVKISEEREDLDQKIVGKFLEGFKMSVEEFQKILVNQGVEKIKVAVLEEEFDPEKHEVIKVSEDDNYDQNVVLKVLREGYLFQKRVLRPAWIEINKKKEILTNNEEK